MKKIVPFMAASMLISMPMVYAATSLNSDQDKTSYAMGFKTGEAMKSRDLQVNSTAFSEGLNDGLQGKTPQLSEQVMNDSIAAMQKKMVAQMQAKYKTMSTDNAKEGQAFLAKTAKQPGVMTTKSGLEYKIIKAGKGKSPKATDTVTVNYEGKLINGTVFDSTYTSKKPATFQVNQVIKGWQEALQMMKPGAVWMLYIPSSLAYGEQGSFGKIGPNETLIFKVELLSVK